MSEIIFKYSIYSILILLVPIISLLVIQTNSFWQEKALMGEKDGLFSNIKRGLAKTVKTFFKYDLICRTSILEIILPLGLLVLYILSFSLFPLSGIVGGLTIQITNSPFAGVLVFIVLIIGTLFSSLIFLNSKHNYARIGEDIFFTKLISFFLPLCVSIITILMHYKSLDFHFIVKSQSSFINQIIPSWGIFSQPLGALVFFVVFAGLSNSNLINYRKEENSFNSGLKMSLASFNYNVYMIAENLCFILSLYLFIFLFLGGYGLLPGMNVLLSNDTSVLVLFQVLSFFIKLICCLMFSRVLCRNLPLLNTQKIFNIGWKGLLPLSFLNFFLYTLWKVF